MVLLDSFTRCNPWFDGPLILIHDGLPSSSHRRLTSLRHLDIRHRMVDARLLERVKAVAARHPPMRLKQRRFFSLEAFNLRDVETGRRRSSTRDEVPKVLIVTQNAEDAISQAHLAADDGELPVPREQIEELLKTRTW